MSSNVPNPNSDAVTLPAASGSGWFAPATLVPAVVIGALLGFGAFTKFAFPNPKQTAFDYATGVGEILVIIALLAMHRRWQIWSFLVVFFAAFTGWSLFKSLHGEACGCFATFWEPPKFFTVIMNTPIILASLVLMGLRGAKMPMVAGAIALGLVAGAAGFAFSDAMTPPRRDETAQKHGGKVASQRLLESAVLADIRAQEPGGAAWFIFAYDPTCHICEAVKPIIELRQSELEATADPIMQIRSHNIVEGEKETRIEPFAWETPTIVIVQDGAITVQWSGKTIETWDITTIETIYNALLEGSLTTETVAGGMAPGEAQQTSPMGQ